MILNERICQLTVHKVLKASMERLALRWNDSKIRDIQRSRVSCQMDWFTEAVPGSGEILGRGSGCGMVFNEESARSRSSSLAIRSMRSLFSSFLTTLLGFRYAFSDHQSIPISLAFSTEQTSRRICMVKSSISTSFTLISPAMTSPLSRIRSRTSAKVEDSTP